jgi:hypothetical protein
MYNKHMEAGDRKQRDVIERIHGSSRSNEYHITHFGLSLLVVSPSIDAVQDHELVTDSLCSRSI